MTDVQERRRVDVIPFVATITHPPDSVLLIVILQQSPYPDLW